MVQVTQKVIAMARAISESLIAHPFVVCPQALCARAERVSTGMDQTRELSRSAGSRS